MNSYYLALNGQQAGPFTSDQLVQMMRDGRVNASTLAFTQGMTQWTPVSAVPELVTLLTQSRTQAAVPPPPPAAATPAAAMPAAGMSGNAAPGNAAPGFAAGSMVSAVSSQTEPGMVTTQYGIHYQVVGAEMQFVEILLDPMQTIVAEAGSMMFMTQGILLDTVLGDGSQQNQGFFNKLLDAGKRVVTGATLFLTTFTSGSGQRETAAFSSPYPGKIVPLDLTALGGTIICEKHSFLCAARGTSINVEFTRRIGAGFFGGEGFILQRLTGTSMAFIHACGTVVERTLRVGETLRVDTGCLVAFQPTVAYDIQLVGNIKTALFGGEGLFFVTLTGPGKVWLQSLPFSRLADRIISASPRAGGSRQESGSILGGIGDLIGGEQ
jgi:uncharacterized protein (TIGR00266 family)